MFPYCCLLITCFFFILCSVFKVHHVRRSSISFASAVKLLLPAESSFIPFFFLSKFDPLRWARIWFGWRLSLFSKAHWNPRLETSINLRRKVLFSSWSAKKRSAIPSKLNNEKFHKWNFWFDFVKSSLLRSILTERPWTTDHRMLRLF